MAALNYLIYVFYMMIMVLINGSLQSEIKNRPIIGVLAEESIGQYVKIGKSYIGASYVKFIESSGARVVPVRLGQTDEYYKDLFGKINGLVMPGGNVPITTSKYAKVARKFFDMAMEAAKKKDMFPIFGVCLGLQTLMTFFSNTTVLSECEDEDNARPLKFVTGIEGSKMYGKMGDKIKNILQTKNVTINYHHYGIKPKDFIKHELDKKLRILSTNQDIYGEDYISSFEAIDYPIYGVQFHPEKNAFVWVQNKERMSIPHSYDAILAAQYFSRFFVNEAKKSKHRFQSYDEETKKLIYNYNPLNTAGIITTMNQMYVFDD